MNDFNRNVYCLAGLPFDAVNMTDAISKIKEAVNNKTRCFISTPNLNFLVASSTDTAFRDSVIQSNLVLADGMPIIWMAKLLGIPIKNRVAGSSLFSALGAENTSRKISTFFFGGPDGVAKVACTNVNNTKGGLTCVGYQYPGFSSVEAMSDTLLIKKINETNADFLVVSLGAKKGQEWITNNLAQLNTPVISHLGAVINFEAGFLNRAPVWMQNIGLEWLWRIKEEPKLWKRYWHDGNALFYLLFTQIVPYTFWLVFRRNKRNLFSLNNSLTLKFNAVSCEIFICGEIVDPVSPEIRNKLQLACQNRTDIALDLTETEYLSPGFLGLVLLLNHHMKRHSLKLTMTGVQPQMKKQFKWNGLDYLL